MGEIMLTRLSSKGQIVLPKALRDAMGLKDGQLFAMFGDDETIVLKKVDVPSKKDLERILNEGQRQARKKRISPKDVLAAIEESRHGGAG